MITAPKQQPTTYTTNGNTIGKRLVATLLLPFTHKYTSPIWLALRLYLAWIWLQMGTQKIQAGWLTNDPIGQMLKLVENGTIPVPLSFYRGVAGMLVDSGITPMLSHSMPFMELAVALSFATGVLVPVAAVGAILLNINFVLSGIGNIELDGPVIAGQLLLVLSYRVVGLIGFEKLVLRILNGALDLVRPAHKAALASQAVDIAERR
jgi:uncharacterized membrane protein YphA (DoxX/SURF4 family)